MLLNEEESHLKLNEAREIFKYTNKEAKAGNLWILTRLQQKINDSGIHTWS